MQLSHAAATNVNTNGSTIGSCLDAPTRQ